MTKIPPMMTDRANFRMERIEKLLYELRYEIERGMMQREIDEHISFCFIVPFSSSYKDGVVRCEFRTDPMSRMALLGEGLYEPKLTLIKK